MTSDLKSGDVSDEEIAVMEEVIGVGPEVNESFQVNISMVTMKQEKTRMIVKVGA